MFNHSIPKLFIQANPFKKNIINNVLRNRALYK